jgi:hypothetical protein
MRKIGRAWAGTAFAALGIGLSWPTPVVGLSCGPRHGFEDEMIRDGWPEAAPYDYVVIATIDDIQPERGDSGTWGEVLRVRIDAVLRGDVPLATTEIFNPPLGSSGWLGFEVGHRYLIGARPPAEGTGGRIYTFLCAARARFDELVSYSAHPVLSDTALEPPGRVAELGWLLVGAALSLAAWRQISSADEARARPMRR